MSVCPPVIVPQPQLIPPKYGLYSVATVLDDQERVACGVTFTPENCTNDAQPWMSNCETPGPEKELPSDNLGSIIQDAFWVLAGKTCLRDEDPVAAARAALITREEKAVEHALWTNADRFNDGSQLPVSLFPFGSTLAGPGPVSFLAGVSALESFAGDQYHSVAVIHAPRGMATWAARNKVLERDGNHYVTPLGTMWSFGRGYPNTGPDGTPAAPGTAWLYISGQVVVRRGEIRVPSVAEALNRENNEVNLIAERPVNLIHDCFVASVLVNASCEC